MTNLPIPRSALHGDNLPKPAPAIKPSQGRLNQNLAKSSAAGDLEGIVRLLDAGADPLDNESRALGLAAFEGHVDCVNFLIPISNPKAANSYALRYAASRGNTECVRSLLLVSDPLAKDSEALRGAVVYGHLECVKLLLPFSNAKSQCSSTLIIAAQRGHAECVKLLIPASHPLIELKTLLPEVFAGGHAQVASVLIDAEPRLLHGVDLPKSRSEALASGYTALAALLSSIIDRQALLTIPDAARAQGSAPPAKRL